MDGKTPKYCTKCGYVGAHNVTSEISGSQWAALVFFLLLFVIPGVIYALHLATGGGARRFNVCPKCGARGMAVPVDSPVAQTELKAAGRPLVPPSPPAQPFSGVSALKVLQGFAILLGLCLVSALANRWGGRQPEVAPVSAVPQAPYVLPSQIKLDVRAERGPEGEIFIVGSTNLPDGMKIGVETANEKRIEGQDFEIFVRNGQFRSAGFTNGKQPYPAGKHKIVVLAYFNEAWQSPQVLSIVGEGGKNLKGKLFKKTDPDVIDSEKLLQQIRTVSFPPFGLDPASKAIHLVKSAILTVPGLGKSAENIESNIAEFMKAPGVAPEPGKGWSATNHGGSVYSVTFDYLNGGEPAQAIWSADVETGTVKYVNEYAKIFSWAPNY
jgi:hypothetical protein